MPVLVVAGVLVLPALTARVGSGSSGGACTEGTISRGVFVIAVTELADEEVAFTPVDDLGETDFQVCDGDDHQPDLAGDLYSVAGAAPDEAAAFLPEHGTTYRLCVSKRATTTRRTEILQAVTDAATAP